MKNIESCLAYINEKHHVTTISKFFITHPHYDHISGIKNLITKNGLSNAEIWLNTFYSFSSKTYGSLLKFLDNSQLRIIQPFPWNNTSNIKILNQAKPILRTKGARKSKGIENIVANGTIASPNQTIIQSKINNSSIIYQFCFGEKSILFPGDIEEDGWAEIKDCIPFLNTTTYYCVSHHGSMNGYIRTTCPSPCRRNILNVRFCCSTARIVFVQGRNGAFPGIMNQSVLNDLSADHGVVHRTDRDRSDRIPKFFEIDWQQDRVTYHY